MKLFSTYIFDMDGVLYRNADPIPEAVATIKELISKGKSIRYLTNNSTLHRDDYIAKLSHMGYPCDKTQIMTSAYGAALHLKSVSAKSAYVVGGAGLKREIAEMGIEISENPIENPVEYVVAGLDREFSYIKLLYAQQAILNGAKFIATNRDPTYPIESGKVQPGGGSIVASIETAANVQGETIGKPEPYLYKLLLDKRENDNAVLAVGDRLDTDILGGIRAGTFTALVLTGVTSREEALSASPEMKPDYIIDSLCELL